jgi:hypothetical protein
MSQSVQIKLGRNDKCYCGSNKKYKACCLGNINSKYILGQPTSSPKVTTIIETFKQKHPEHVFIDVSTYTLNDDLYREYQLHNIRSNIVMIAERLPENESIFVDRIQDPEADIMIMYHGSYRTFFSGRMDYFVKSISNMITM